MSRIPGKNASYEEIDTLSAEDLIAFAEAHYYRYLDYVEERAKRHPVTKQNLRQYRTSEGEDILVIENIRENDDRKDEKQ